MIKIAAVQFHSKENTDENLERSKRFIELAVEKEARLIAFPELFLTPWFPAEISEKAFKNAISLKSHYLKLYKGLSKKFDTIIVVPFFESYKRSYYNSTAVFDCGKLSGVYRKVHIPSIPYWEEKYYFKSGKDFPVFDTSIGKIGIQTCWDNFFFEGYRSLALQGAKLVISPTASAYQTQSRWRMVIATHALLNNIFILRVNRVGKEKHQEFYGNSFLVGPDGILVGKTAGSLEGIFLSEVDFNLVDRVRKYFPFLRDRKPESYKPICGEKDE